MFRKAVLVCGLLGLFAPLGCSTRDPVIWSWPHNKRHVNRVLEGFHQMHMDIDRIIFDMPTYPKEVDY